MVKLTETYNDYNNVERTEDFYFELNEAEVLELQAKEQGNLGELIERIIAEKDSEKLINFFKKIVLMAYGEKSVDGRYFVKDENITKKFTQTKAYPKIFMKLALNAKAASDFINGIIPSDLEDQINKIRAENEK